ncbi:MAG TPA: TetR/AcrR family transcriptional regulator [Pseudonocardiaceae bacterium]|jgi:AcrR family transcriptional regulator|nr:TetR/AcrR family transcriptional regulator [Pseudonocardiaceae bacterium]
MADDLVTGPKGRGRPRDPAVEKAILRATLARLVSDGYARMTIGDIAADAGVTRPTVYRRWADKHDLVVDALDFSLQQEQVEHPAGEIGQLPPEEALTEALRRIVPPGVRERGLGLIGNVMAEAKHNPGLLKLVQQHLIVPQLRVFVETLQCLQKQGHIRAGLNLDVIADLCLGSYFATYLRTGELDPALPDRVVGALWAMIAVGDAVSH